MKKILLTTEFSVPREIPTYPCLSREINKLAGIVDKNTNGMLILNHTVSNEIKIRTMISRGDKHQIRERVFILSDMPRDKSLACIEVIERLGPLGTSQPPEIGRCTIGNGTPHQLLRVILSSLQELCNKQFSSRMDIAINMRYAGFSGLRAVVPKKIKAAAKSVFYAELES